MSANKQEMNRFPLRLGNREPPSLTDVSLRHVGGLGRRQFPKFPAVPNVGNRATVNRETNARQQDHPKNVLILRIPLMRAREREGVNP